MRDGVEQATDEESPPVDPDAIADAYRYHRARRRARVEHRRSLKLAGLRFWLVLLVLVGACVVLALTLWREVERLFGL